MTNTEKPTTKAEQKKQGIVETPKSNQNQPVQPVKKIEEKQESKSIATEKETKDKKIEKKSEKPKIKKTEAVVNGTSIPISTKQSMGICKFIKNKKISQAILDLEQVIQKKKAVPMKGEIAHKKGKGMMSGKYPKKASENFIRLLKTLSANAAANELDEPIIVEAFANFASRPFGRFGRVKKKRSHIKIIAREKKKVNKQKIKAKKKKSRNKKENKIKDSVKPVLNKEAKKV